MEGVVASLEIISVNWGFAGVVDSELFQAVWPKWESDFPSGAILLVVVVVWLDEDSGGFCNGLALAGRSGEVDANGSFETELGPGTAFVEKVPPVEVDVPEAFRWFRSRMNTGTV
ncbi:hypothetical protein Agabi119p4_8578 [Agaricus bisporus var. burnettii]|uniref:Uncharacterized protein n=1 Tax=Agaricus bisporus var. burnettii TaxID=192524 RepID=A0A8H7EYV9_AGABI|nr:hypothetical protein Agabi119p4_8578 [Agaricus bisporus var. burnettii]